MLLRGEEPKTTDDNEQVVRHLTDFLLYLENGRQLAKNSTLAYQRDIEGFIAWLQETAESVFTVDNRHINQYLYARLAKGYKTSSNARLLASLKAFYQYLLIQKLISTDPCFAIAVPKIQPSEMSVLEAAEVDRLLAVPNIESAIGLRDKAMLEVLYSTGVSVSELISLRIDLLSLNERVIKVESSKGMLRDVYLTSQCCDWLALYLKDVRQALQIKDENDWIFLSERGLRMTRQTFWYRVKTYVAKSGLSDNISPQTLRRSFAVHILQSGVELSVVQQILGHKHVLTTSQYI